MSEIACLDNVGTISNDICSIMSFEWKIPNYFQLIQKSNQRINSPSFKFLDATWYLSLYEKEETELNAEKWIGLYLIKKHSAKVYVYYTIGIRNFYGQNFKVWRNEKYFSDDGRGEGCARLVKRSEINNNRVAPQGRLTVFCILHNSRMDYTEMTTQTEVHEGEDEYTERNQLCVGKNGKRVLSNPSGLYKTLQDLKDLLVSGEGSDVVIKVKDQEFKAHRLILRTRSPVFRSMFQHSMKEETSGIIDVTDCDPVAFKDFLSYLYCGTVKELSANNVFDLYRIGDKYDVKDLQDKCVEFMMDKISVDSFPEVITLALQHEESSLIEIATCFFIENATKITESAYWISFLKEHPIEANELFRKTLKGPKK